MNLVGWRGKAQVTFAAWVGRGPHLFCRNSVLQKFQGAVVGLPMDGRAVAEAGLDADELFARFFLGHDLNRVGFAQLHKGKVDSIGSLKILGAGGEQAYDQ